MSSSQPILSPKARQQRNHAEMSAAILQAARAVMREQGVADLNLQEVARRVGMRAPSLYNYFDGRNAIYAALFADGMRLYCDRLEALHAQYGGTWEGLQKVMEGYLAFGLEHPELYQLLFERPVPGFVPSAEGLEQSQRLLGIARRMAGDAVSEGTLQPPVTLDVTVNLVVALMHGITALHLANEPHLPSGEGRFGSLIPVMIDLLRRAWGQDSQSESQMSQG